MTNPFGSTSIAEGYAVSRPPLHPLILQRVAPCLPPGKVARALDIGCGAGLSTAALEGVAQRQIGLEPAREMLRCVARTAPGARFVVARAEAIPLRSQSVDLITAAGSLNYTNPALFFREAARVLIPGGLVIAYDFSPGRSFPGSAALDDWFDAFVARYPWPPGEALHLDPERLSALADAFRMFAQEHFEIGITLTPAFYRDYMMTETNIAFALRNGASEPEIRSWCSRTLRPVWDEGPREVLFRGYYACLKLMAAAAGDPA